MSLIEFELVGPNDPDAVALARAATDEGARVYGHRDSPAPRLDELLGADDRLLVGRGAGRPIAVGGVRILEPGVGEIKRMFVVAGERGRGIGRSLLEALEDQARTMGCERLRLDTGGRQAAAIALYRSAGYRETGDYNSNPGAALWFEKRL